MKTYEDPFEDLLKIMQASIDELLEHKYQPPDEERQKSPVKIDKIETATTTPITSFDTFQQTVEEKEKKYEMELNLSVIKEEI